MKKPYTWKSAALALPVTMLPALGAAQGTESGTALVDVVRRATNAFQDPEAATAAGYAPSFGCVSGPLGGAMGLHLVNGDLVGDGGLDAERPEALLYEERNGRLRLLGVEYVVLAEEWDARNAGPPALLGQAFHFTGSPNRFRLPAFYALHVWAWRHNPAGTFADWNPRVSCNEHTAETPPESGER